jgi:polar amino acid transport system permease protein
MDMYRFVVLPQAARISLPPLVSLTIVMFHATSLASVITVPEIMDAAHFVGSNTFQYMSVYVAAAVLYAVIAIPGALLAHQLERRLGTPTSLTRTLFRQTPKKTAAM